MTKNRKTLLISLSCALALIIALCSFGAYAQNAVENSDGSLNNTTADLIEQYQFERGANNTFVTVESTSSNTKGDMFPSYNSWNLESCNGTLVISNDEKENVKYDLWASSDAIDRIVCVKNKSNVPIYVRTVFAFECGELTYDLFKKYVIINKNNKTWSWDEFLTEKVEIKDSETGASANYFICCATYNGTSSDGILSSLTISDASLLQFALASSVKQADIDSFGATYKVLVYSQATSVANIDSLPDDGSGSTSEEKANAKDVLNTVFGEITVDNHPWKNNQ